MIEKITCQNRHKVNIDWELGKIYDSPCKSEATKYTIDHFGIFYLCEECYISDCKRRLDSDYLSINQKGV